MMKNTEWGAVAYLSLSNYGINKAININNNSDFMTGYSSVSLSETGTDSSVTLPYNTETGYQATTTGNITGIYDMSGGAEEYMAAFFDGPLDSTGGFQTDPTITYGAKYFDKYPNTSTATSFNNRILGDATGEIGPFYKYDIGNGYNITYNNWMPSRANFVNSGHPWITRGGCYLHAPYNNQLLFLNSLGSSIDFNGFRLVLAN